MLIVSVFRISEILCHRNPARTWKESRVVPSADFAFPFPKTLERDMQGLGPLLDPIKLPETTREVSVDMIKYQTRILIAYRDYWVLCEAE